MEKQTKSETPPRTHFGNPFEILNRPPRSHFEKPFLIREVSREVPRRCPRRCSRVFGKPPLCCFTLNPGTPRPLVVFRRTPHFVLGPLYLDGEGSLGGPLWGGAVPGTSFPVAPQIRQVGHVPLWRRTDVEHACRKRPTRRTLQRHNESLISRSPTIAHSLNKHLSHAAFHLETRSSGATLANPSGQFLQSTSP